ncbi:MAG: chemotaxis protein CheX [Myxococcota bacterium]
MTIDPSELAAVASQVWQLIMASEIEQVAVGDLNADAAPHVAHIELTGAYRAEVALQLDAQLTRSAAATMFDLSEDEVTPSHMADTARELANMVGGNMKSLVEQPTQLGLPELTSAPEFHKARPPASFRLAFEHRGAPLQLSVYEP